MVDADGWIAREQILGEEARSRVRIVQGAEKESVHTSPGTKRIPNASS